MIQISTIIFRFWLSFPWLANRTGYGADTETIMLVCYQNTHTYARFHTRTHTHARVSIKSGPNRFTAKRSREMTQIGKQMRK